jgi:hypothetical protein
VKPSNVGRLTFDQVVRLPLQVFVMTLVARRLGPERSGAYAYLFAIAALALALATVGPDAISMRRRAADPGGHGRTVAAALAFAVAPAGLALIPGFGALGAVVAALLSDRLAAHGISFPCPWLRSAARGQSRASHPVAAAVRLRQVYRGGGRDISPDRAAGRPLHVQPARPCRAHPRGALRERRSGGDVSPGVRAILPEDDVETPRGFPDFMSAALARARQVAGLACRRVDGRDRPDSASALLLPGRDDVAGAGRAGPTDGRASGTGALAAAIVGALSPGASARVSRAGDGRSRRRRSRL